MAIANIYLESLPGEDFLTKNLQRELKFTLGKKIIKQGRLVIFKRIHYCINITLLNQKNNKESFEIPIPFQTEEYTEEGLMFFDYRVRSLVNNSCEITDKLYSARIKKIEPSHYYNKILEIQTNI
jgi:hypothetical protein